MMKRIGRKVVARAGQWDRLVRVLGLLLVVLALAFTSTDQASAAPGLLTGDRVTNVPPEPKTVAHANEGEIWGACGLITDPAKIVRTYGGVKGIRRVYLTCGGPRFNERPAWGYRHILRFHRGQWEDMSAGTYQNWRQIADLAMATALADPEVRGSERDGKRCFSRHLRLYNTRTGELIRRQIVKVVFRTSDNAIITAYPTSKQCR